MKNLNLACLLSVVVISASLQTVPLINVDLEPVVGLRIGDGVGANVGPVGFDIGDDYDDEDYDYDLYDHYDQDKNYDDNGDNYEEDEEEIIVAQNDIVPNDITKNTQDQPQQKKWFKGKGQQGKGHGKGMTAEQRKAKFEKIKQQCPKAAAEFQANKGSCAKGDKKCRMEKIKAFKDACQKENPDAKFGKGKFGGKGGKLGGKGKLDGKGDNYGKGKKQQALAS